MPQQIPHHYGGHGITGPLERRWPDGYACQNPKCSRESWVQQARWPDDDTPVGKCGACKRPLILVEDS